MRVRQVVTVACQLLVGGLFVFSGLTKAIDPVGTSIKIEEYLRHFGWLSLSGIGVGAAWLLSLVEFALGFYIVIGRHRLATTVVALAFLGVMTPLTLYLGLYNPVEHCGCFGDAILLTNWESFAKNVLMLLLIGWLHWYRYQQFAVMSRLFHTLYFYVEVAGVFFLLVVGTWQLPYIDFRPYRPGVSLVGEEAEVGPEAQPQIVYEREGQRHTFALDSLPDESEGWVFVETLLPESPSAPAQPGEGGVVLFDEAGEDVSRQVLADTGYVMLLLSPDLDQAEEHDVDRVENLYEYALQQGYSFHCVTMYDPERIERWKYRTGAEYPFLYADQQVVETMIRRNPGFMLLHNGVIQWKSHLSGIDMGLLTSAKLSEQSLGQIQPIDRKKRVFWIFVWLIAPMLLYLPLQIIKNHKKNKK